MDYDPIKVKPYWKFVLSTFINLMLLQTCIPEGEPRLHENPFSPSDPGDACRPKINGKILFWCSQEEGRKEGLPPGVPMCSCIWPRKP